MSSIGTARIFITEEMRGLKLAEGESIKFADLELKMFPEEERKPIEELANSIKEHGLLQPIGVKDVGENFRLIWGLRRLMAVKILGLKQIEAKIDKGRKDEEPIKCLIENVQRSNVNPLATANMLVSIQKASGVKDQASLAKLVGKSQGWVSQHLSLLKADPEVKDAVRAKELTLGGARSITSLPPARQKEVLKLAKERSGSAKKIKTKAVEKEAAKAKKPDAPVLKPLQEREEKQKSDLLGKFFSERGVKDDGAKKLVSEFWDFLMDEKRIIIKA